MPNRGRQGKCKTHHVLATEDLVETQPDVQDIVEVDVIVSEETKSSLAPEVNTTTNAEDNISIASIATEDSMRIIPTKENELSVLDTDHGPILLSQEEGGLNTSINLDTGSSVIDDGDGCNEEDD